MRKSIAILAMALLAVACTPEQVALIVKQQQAGSVTVVQEVKKPTVGIDPAVIFFLTYAATLHNHPFLTCTRGYESDSAGGYQAVNPSGYYGAYQFDRNTWDTVAQHAGQPQLVGVQIISVPGFFQDYLAMDLYLWQGNRPWGGRC